MRVTSAAASAGFLTRAQAVSRWRERRRELMASEPVRSPLRGAGRGAQQLVSYLGHGADDDYGLLAHGYASGDDGCGALDGGRVFNRRAAKLHDYQAHANLPIVRLPETYARAAATASDSSLPRLASNSALRMVAPAAPRTVLCESSTNFQSSRLQGRRRPTVTAMPLPRLRSRRG